jgi:hypothetical protein
MMNTAVVFLVFNRPDMTRRVFERIRQARPPKLLIVCDGPRRNEKADIELVIAVREVIEYGVDWPCDVYQNYAVHNMGCRQRVASGLNWAFEHVEEAIILEDDCLPDHSFFPFCDTLLERYRDDERVMHINGTNFISSTRTSSSYFYSKYVWVWGWATWRRAWDNYDYAMSGLDHSISKNARNDWEKAATWDFSWIFSCWVRSGFSIVPSANLVENLGFGPLATHTLDTVSHLQVRSACIEIDRHPSRFTRSQLLDDKMFRAYLGEPSGWSNDLACLFRVLRRRLQMILKQRDVNLEK